MLPSITIPIINIIILIPDGNYDDVPPLCVEGKLSQCSMQKLTHISAVTYMIGFENTSYTVAEGESVEVCVIVRDPPDIGGVELFVQVLNNNDTSVLIADAGVACKKQVEHGTYL